MAKRRAKREKKRPPASKSRGSELLADWCSRRNLSTAEACIALGLNESALYSFQAGRTAPGLRRAIRIQEATGIPVISWIEAPVHVEDAKPKRARAA